MEHERIPFPEKMINWLDIARGIGGVALDFLTKQFQHETPSEHFRRDVETEAYGKVHYMMPHFDSEGRYMDNDGNDAA